MAVDLARASQDARVFYLRVNPLVSIRSNPVVPRDR